MTEREPEKKPESVCPYCGGVGYVRLQVPVGHPQFGKAVPCICKRREMREHRLVKLLEDSNLLHLRNMRFDTFEIKEDVSNDVRVSLQDALGLARAFAENPRGWLLFRRLWKRQNPPPHPSPIIAWRMARARSLSWCRICSTTCGAPMP